MNKDKSPIKEKRRKKVPKEEEPFKLHRTTQAMVGKKRVQKKGKAFVEGKNASRNHEV